MRSIPMIAVALGAVAAFAACDEGSGSAETDAGADSGPDELFTDANLEQCVRDALGMASGELSADQLASLTHLECRDMGIAAVDGLEACSGLVSLSLWENDIVDATPLAGLAGLQHLDIGNNRISDLSWASGLDALTRLGLSVNEISDLAPLAGMTGLEWLNLDANQITDPSPLAGLAGLTWLTIERNGIGGNTGALDNLAADGCEVYAEYQDMFSIHGPAGGGGGARRLASMISSRAPLDPGAGLSEYRPGRAGSGPTAFDEYPDWALENTELLPIVLASPNQYDAGSCLFMATTGAAEVLMSQHVPLEEVTYLGDTDLSERFLMNASEYVPASQTAWFFTDLVYAYNVLSGSMLDRDYPMAAGGGSLNYSWNDDLPVDWEEMLVETPPVERTTIFADPLKNADSQWNVGLMDDRHVERIKYELRMHKAPVIVVYNHYLYWHTNVIVGYDDTVETYGCPMVEDMVDYFEDQGATAYANKVLEHMEELGGCTDYGIFYVRDSIYPGDAEDPTYHYGGPQAFDAPYSERIIPLDYNWVKFLANHVTAVHRSWSQP